MDFKLKLFLTVFVFLTFNLVSKSQGYYEKACNEFAYGDLVKCEFLFTEAIKTNEQIANSYMYRGAAKMFLNNIDAAILDLDSSKIKRSFNGRLYYYYSRCYLIRRDFIRALEYCDLALTHDSTDAEFYDERAVIRAALNDFEGAILDDDRAIEIDSLQETFYSDRAFSKIQLRQYESAIKDLNISLNIVATSKAYANRGFAYLKMNRYDLAIKDFSSALKMNFYDGDVLYFRSKCYFAIGNAKDGCADLNQSSKLGNQNAQVDLIKNKCDSL